MILTRPCPAFRPDKAYVQHTFYVFSNAFLKRFVKRFHMYMYHKCMYHSRAHADKIYSRASNTPSAAVCVGCSTAGGHQSSSRCAAAGSGGPRWTRSFMHRIYSSLPCCKILIISPEIEKGVLQQNKNLIFIANFDLKNCKTRLGLIKMSLRQFEF